MAAQWTFLKLLNSSWSPLNTQCWQKGDWCVWGEVGHEEGRSMDHRGKGFFLSHTTQLSMFSFFLSFSLNHPPAAPKFPCTSLPSGGAHKGWYYQEATLPLARLQWRVELEEDSHRAGGSEEVDKKTPKLPHFMSESGCYSELFSNDALNDALQAWVGTCWDPKGGINPNSPAWKSWREAELSCAVLVQAVLMFASTQ